LIMKLSLPAAANAEHRTPNIERRTQKNSCLNSAFGVCFSLSLLFLLAACTNTTPPIVAPEMVLGKDSNRTVALTKLEHGRVLFASRCIECHTLPPVNAHDASEWPCLVSWMAKRASLKPEEREAMIAYLVAARAQELGSGCSPTSHP
jgi:hypothetical protein